MNMVEHIKRDGICQQIREMTTAMKYKQIEDGSAPTEGRDNAKEENKEDIRIKRNDNDNVDRRRWKARP